MREKTPDYQFHRSAMCAKMLDTCISIYKCTHKAIICYSGFRQLAKEKENLELQLAEALRVKESLAQERTEQDEQSQSLRRQLSSVSDELSENHEREVNQLREELQNTNTAMETVLTNGEQLKVNGEQLMEKNENLFAECEKLKAECTQR